MENHANDGRIQKCLLISYVESQKLIKLILVIIFLPKTVKREIQKQAIAGKYRLLSLKK